jgi:hypothetical protein
MSRPWTPGAGGGGIALVQSATQVSVQASAASEATITINGTISGNCLVVYAAILDVDEDFTITSVTDGGNSWTFRSGICTETPTRSYVVIAYAVNITGGNRTISINLSGVSGLFLYYEIGCQEWSGVATASPEDTFDSNDDIDCTSADVSAGPITTTISGDLLVGVAHANLGDTTMNFVQPTNWTNIYRENDSLNKVGMDGSYWLPGATQTGYTAQWSHDNAAHEGTAVIVALKPA